jgi:hypothetical protein
MRRGALIAFERLAALFGGELMERVPKFWEGISAPFAAFDGESTVRNSAEIQVARSMKRTNTSRQTCLLDRMLLMLLPLYGLLRLLLIRHFILG